MQKINFQNLPSTTTPVNATNLNALQDNVEDVFDGDVPMGNVVVDSIRSKNMFNVGSVLPNTAISSGVIISNNDYDIFVIKVDNNTQYTLSKTSFNGGILGYYSAFPKIGDTLTDRQSLANVSNLTFTTANTYLCLMISHSDNKNTIQVEKGSTATNYAPYQFGENGDVFINGKLYTSNAGREDYADFGFYYDGAGNMQHKRNNAGDQFQIKAHDGTAKVIILPETGNVDTFGNITFIPLQTQTLDLNLVGTTYVASQEVALHNTGNIQNAPANNEVAILKSYSWGGNPDWCMQEWFGLNYGGSLSKYIRQHTPAGWNAWQRII